jgi:hypothetical protein
MWRHVTSSDFVRADYHTAFEARGTLEAIAKAIGARVEDVPDNGLGPARAIFLINAYGRGAIVSAFDYAQHVHPGGPWFCVQLPNARSPMHGAPLLSQQLAKSLQDWLHLPEKTIIERYPCLPDA